jgi:hypothetical protein
VEDTGVDRLATLLKEEHAIGCEATEGGDGSAGCLVLSRGVAPGWAGRALDVGPRSPACRGRSSVVRGG